VCTPRGLQGKTSTIDDEIMR